MNAKVEDDNEKEQPVIFQPTVSAPIDILTDEIAYRLENSGKVTVKDGNVIFVPETYHLLAYDQILIDVKPQDNKIPYPVAAPGVPHGHFVNEGTDGESWKPTAVSNFRSRATTNGEFMTDAACYDLQFFSKEGASIPVRGAVNVRPADPNTQLNLEVFSQRFQNWNRNSQGKRAKKKGVYDVTLCKIWENDGISFDLKAYNFDDYFFNELQNEAGTSVWKTGYFRIDYELKEGTPQLTVESRYIPGPPSESWNAVLKLLIPPVLDAWHIKLPRR